MSSPLDAYRALVCITSCMRVQRLRRYLPHFASAVAEDPRYFLLVALDGREPEYVDFCDQWDVPLLMSEEREGVGLSKNRVLKQFPDFDYYFFLEDDTELADPAVFHRHVEMHRISGIHHFTLGPPDRLRKLSGETLVEGTRILHGFFGEAQFNFFTRVSLERVGGWHPLFAEYRRFGHTEHSYRVHRAGLAPAPFNLIPELASALVWHFPPAVTTVRDVPITADDIPKFEWQLILDELDRVPIETISAYEFNGKTLDGVKPLASLLGLGNRYPLVEGRERRECESSYLLWRAQHSQSLIARLALLVRAFAAWPLNPAVKHYVKRTLQGLGPK